MAYSGGFWRVVFLSAMSKYLFYIFQPDSFRLPLQVSERHKNFTSFTSFFTFSLPPPQKKPANSLAKSRNFTISLPLFFLQVVKFCRFPQLSQTAYKRVVLRRNFTDFYRYRKTSSFIPSVVPRSGANRILRDKRWSLLR